VIKLAFLFGLGKVFSAAQPFPDFPWKILTGKYGLELKGENKYRVGDKYALNNYLVFAVQCLSSNKSTLHAPAESFWRTIILPARIFIFYH